MKRIALVFTLMGIVACSGRLGDFTVASNKNIMISSFDSGAMQSSTAEGKDCKAIILGIPTGVPNIESALDKALSAGGGNFMTDAVMTWNQWTAIVYGQHCFKVTGNVWALRVAQADPASLESLASTQTPVLLRLENGEKVLGNMVGFGSDHVVLHDEAGQLMQVDRADIQQIEAIEPTSSKQ